MNWSEVQDEWGQLKIVLVSHWPELSIEEVERIDGNRDRLISTLRRHGRSAAEAEQEVCAFEKDVRYPGAVK